MENQDAQEHSASRSENSADQVPTSVAPAPVLCTQASTRALIRLFPQFPGLEQDVIALVNSRLLSTKPVVPPPPSTPFPTGTAGASAQQPPGPPSVAAEEADTGVASATVPSEEEEERISRSQRRESRHPSESEHERKSSQCLPSVFKIS